jgi:hypothetical protein
LVNGLPIFYELLKSLFKLDLEHVDVVYLVVAASSKSLEDRKIGIKVSWMSLQLLVVVFNDAIKELHFMLRSYSFMRLCVLKLLVKLFLEMKLRRAHL